MSSGKYNRLPSHVPPRKYKFQALEGPGYFTYDAQPGKYSSMFSYSRAPSTEYSSPSAATSTSLLSADAQPLLEQVVVCGDESHTGAYLGVQEGSRMSRVLIIIASALCYLLFIVTLPMSLCFTLKVVQTFERIVVFRLGRLLDSKGPGYVVVLPCIDRWVTVDLRTKAFSVPPQMAITADGATIEVGADVYFRVKDAILSVANVQNLNHATRILCQTSLQRHISKQNLSDIGADNVVLNDALLNDVNQMAQSWGTEISRIQLSTVKVHTQPRSPKDHACDVINYLSSVLFPPGISNAPIEQLQQFYGAAFANRMVSANDIEKRNMTGSSSAAPSDEAETSKSELLCPDDLISRIQPYLSPALVRDFGCIYKFVVVDDNGAAIYHLDLKHGSGHAGTGEPVSGAADVTLHLTSDLLSDLLAERVSAFNAYMDGQLTVAGDLRLALKFGELVKSLNITSAPR